MASLLRIAGRTLANKAKAFLVDDEGRLEVNAQLKGRIDDLAVNRPAADSVDKGTVFWAVDTGEVSVSTGAEWRSLGVV